MEFEFLSWAFVTICAFAFLAGFVDAVVGGGGLVTVPVLFVMFPASPVPVIIGTNRFSSVPGTILAAAHYMKHVSMPWTALGISVGGAACLSYLGALVSKSLSPDVLKPIMLLFMIGIAIYTYIKKNLGHDDDTLQSPLWTNWLALAIGMTVGFYNGFFGPGSGSLLVFGFVSLVGFSFLKSSAMAKVVNVVADLSSLVFFVGHGFVFYKLAIPMTLCQIGGSFVGSRMAVLRGNRFIRYVFLVVVFGLIVRFGYDVIKAW